MIGKTSKAIGSACSATLTVDAGKPGVPVTTRPVTGPAAPTTVDDGNHGNDD